VKTQTILSIDVKPAKSIRRLLSILSDRADIIQTQQGRINILESKIRSDNRSFEGIEKERAEWQRKFRNLQRRTYRT